jgi:DNA-binding transcriptional LysR family regulator
MVDLVERLTGAALTPPDSSLIIRRLTPWRHVLCCAPSYLKKHGPLRSADELADRNCPLRVLSIWRRWHLPARLENVAVQVKGNLLTNNAEALRRMTLDGHGICWARASCWPTTSRRPTGAIARRPIQFAINALYPHRHHVSTKVRRFIDLLAERLTEHREWPIRSCPGSDGSCKFRIIR